MKETLKSLNNIRTLRAQTKHYAIDTLIDMHDKLQAIVDERHEDIKRSKVERDHRESKLMQYCEMMVADGISPDELLQLHDGGQKEIYKK